ncbi:terminase [Actinomyces procaprae]|uniref:terminase n=1 Tax=Actinomyces procaprae TaxID=2560010 RepID=UPI0010A21ED5|nr:terminase [Actinomyces procaprae]
MARPRSAKPALLHDHAAEYAEIEAWYRGQLARTVPPEGLAWAPNRIGPVWDWEPGRGWLLPERTIGWQVLSWAGFWLNAAGGGPWTYTMEQARFILWFYAVDDAGRFLTPNAVLQRLKGWGKDPLAATMSAVGMIGPSVPELHPSGEVTGRAEPDAWVQILAVAQEQTANTMKLFPSLFSPECRSWYGVQVGKANVWAMDDTRQIQAVTSNPLTVEGGRPTFVLRNETQNWVASNNGHAMAGAVDGNVAKSTRERQARILDICNAYVDGRDSVAQRTREGWEKTQGPHATHADFGLLYDSLEAPESAPLTAEAVPEVVRAVRGDAVWLDEDRILKSVLDPRNPPSESRRKWFNQVAAEEDAWFNRREWDRCADTELVLDPGDELAVFFDGGKSDDATALMGCRILDGAVFTLGMWQRPPEARANGWVAPRDRIDETVRGLLDTHNVVALWADPSHTRDDETMALFWDSIIDGWHRDYGRRLRLWADGKRKGGHSVMWDMSDPQHAEAFVQQVGRTTAEVGSLELVHDGDIRLRTHVLNARRMPTKWGMSIGKNHRESRRKVDLAVAMVGARLARRTYVNSGRRRGGRGIW